MCLYAVCVYMFVRERVKRNICAVEIFLPFKNSVAFLGGNLPLSDRSQNWSLPFRNDSHVKLLDILLHLNQFVAFNLN